MIPFEKSKNLVQDEKLVIECKVLGFPKPSITWFKDSELIKVGEVLRYPKPSVFWFKGWQLIKVDKVLGHPRPFIILLKKSKLMNSGQLLGYAQVLCKPKPSVTWLYSRPELRKQGYSIAHTASNARRHGNSVV